MSHIRSHMVASKSISINSDYAERGTDKQCATCRCRSSVVTYPASHTNRRVSKAVKIPRTKRLIDKAAR